MLIVLVVVLAVTLCVALVAHLGILLAIALNLVAVFDVEAHLDDAVISMRACAFFDAAIVILWVKAACADTFEAQPATQMPEFRPQALDPPVPLDPRMVAQTGSALAFVDTTQSIKRVIDAKSWHLNAVVIVSLAQCR